MARKATENGLVNSYTARQLAQRIVKQNEEITSLKKQLEESEKKQIKVLKETIKKLTAKIAQQEIYLNTISETAQRYQKNKNNIEMGE